MVKNIVNIVVNKERVLVMKNDYTYYEEYLKEFYGVEVEGTYVDDLEPVRQMLEADYDYDYI